MSNRTHIVIHVAGSVMLQFDRFNHNEIKKTCIFITFQCQFHNFANFTFDKKLRVCLSACWDTNPPGPGTPRTRNTPWEQTPPDQTLLWEQTPRPPPPRREPTPPFGQTDACKNITIATSLRTVNIDIASVHISVTMTISPMT